MGSKKNDGGSEERRPKKNRTLNSKGCGTRLIPYSSSVRSFAFAWVGLSFLFKRYGAVREAKSVPV
jgi:hypothetical protein